MVEYIDNNLFCFQWNVENASKNLVTEPESEIVAHVENKSLMSGDLEYSKINITHKRQKTIYGEPYQETIEH